jgi:hypothetical protein
MLSLDMRGVAELLAKNASFARALKRAIKNPLQRGARKSATEARKQIPSSGIGRTIWGKNPSGLTKQKLVTAIEPRGGGESVDGTLTGDAVVTGVKLRGIPRLLEDGGRIKPHTIKPRGGAVGRARLAFMGSRGLVMPRSVRHPGAPVRAHGFAAATLQRNGPAIVADVNLSVQNAVAEAYAGGVARG